MVRIPKLVTLAAYGAVAFMLPNLFLPLLGGVVLYRALVEREAMRMAADPDYVPAGLRRRRRRDRRLERRMSREAAVEYSFSGGFDAAALPKGMTLDAGSVESSFTGSKARFACAGIPRLVEGVGRGRGVVYSFRLDDAAARLDAVREKAGRFGSEASVRREPDGSYLVTAKNAAAINDLANAAFPSTAAAVSRSVVHERQWVVTGCSTYAEAEERLRRLREADPDLAPERSVTTVRTVVDGREGVVSNGSLMDASGELPAGAFLVTEREETVRSGEYIVAEGREDIAVDSLESDPAAKVERTVSVSDGTPQGVGRYVEDGFGERVALCPEGALLAGAPLKAYLVCDSADSLAEVVNADSLPEGAYLVLQRGVPEVPDGSFVVSVDVDADILRRLSPQGGAASGLAESAAGAGVDGRRVDESLIAAQMRRDGYASVRLSSEIGMDRVSVSGVPVKELADRLADRRLPSLDRDAASLWIREAARIRAVSFTVDPRKSVLRIDTLTDSVRKTEERPLTDAEVRSLSARGAVTRAEMKDIYMQMHPSLFKTYSVGGHALYGDPLADFIEGRPPRKAAGMAGPSAAERRSVRAGRKPDGGPSVG